MFENVRDLSPHVARTFKPPIPVRVDLRQIFRAGVGRCGGQANLLVRAQAVPLVQIAPGALYAWVRTTKGAWLGYVAYVINAGKMLGTLRACHLVAADALRPRTEGEPVPRVQ